MVVTEVTEAKGAKGAEMIVTEVTEVTEAEDKRGVEEVTRGLEVEVVEILKGIEVDNSKMMMTMTNMVSATQDKIRDQIIKVTEAPKVIQSIVRLTIALMTVITKRKRQIIKAIVA